MIGWIILVALLVPALALGRWVDCERRRFQPPGAADPVAVESDLVVHAAAAPPTAVAAPTRSGAAPSGGSRENLRTHGPASHPVRRQVSAH